MRSYIGDVFIAACELLCGLTNHAYACWVVNTSPLRKVYWWAIEAAGQKHHFRCPKCDHPYPDEGLTAKPETPWTEIHQRIYEQGFMDGQRQTIDFMNQRAGLKPENQYRQ